MIMEDGRVGALYLPLAKEEQAKYLLTGENNYSSKTKEILYSKIS